MQERRINPQTGREELIEPGEDLEEELLYVSEYEGDPYKGVPLKVIRHVNVTPEPEMGARPCFEVELPDDTTKFYLDPRIGTYQDKQGKPCRLLLAYPNRLR